MKNLGWPCYNLMETTKVLLWKVWAHCASMQGKVDLNIQVYNTVKQGLTFLVRICCEECLFLPPLSFVIIMHPTTLYLYSSVWLPGLEKSHQFQQKFANNFHLFFPQAGRSGSFFWCVDLVDKNSTFAEGGVATILRSARLRFLFLRL